MNIFEEADSVLDNFIINNLTSYHKLRNYDFGTENRSNVSQISKYLSHRILYEYAIIKKLKISDKRQKYTDEILWRIYWRGYLENHKSIWFEYLNFKENSNNSNVISSAIYGKTGIDCFDTWIKELRENNYLHNHSRMWLASIWIFTLGLPWQLGAKFFMRHLFDGDAASNTLSWRWVAGMHTNNKPYLASKENIDKYTLNRFRQAPISISKNINILKNNQHQSNKLPVQRSFPDSNILLMFENDMNILNRSKLFNSYSKVYILSNVMSYNRSNFSEKVTQFKLGLIYNINKLISNSEVIKTTDLKIFLREYKRIDVIYPGVGHNQDLINNYAKRNQIRINYIYRNEDLLYWSHADSGFYKFKKSFYKLNNI